MTLFIQSVSVCCCSSVAAWGRRQLSADRSSGDYDCSSLQLFHPLRHFFWPAFSPSAPVHWGDSSIPPPSMKQSGNKGYWTKEEWQARSREGERKQTSSAISGAYGLARASQLLSSHPANHTTGVTSCSGDSVRFGRILRATVVYLLTLNEAPGPLDTKKQLCWVKGAPGKSLLRRAADNCCPGRQQHTRGS